MRLETIGRQVMDHFSTGRLSVWGRPLLGVRRGSLKRIDEPSFWDHANFTYWFLDEGHEQLDHVTHRSPSAFFDYADLQVNHAEVLAIWPVSGAPEDDRTEIMLLDAARRTYGETRNDPAASFAEAFGNTPEQILTWYCIYLSQHMQLYGARRPSARIEPVTLDNPTKDFHLINNSLTLRERNGSAVFDNLRVKLDELPEVVRALKGLKA